MRALLVLVLLLVSPAHAAQELLVFAAASLTESLQEIGAAFEQEHGVTVRFSFAGSNDLARQIRAGAPADVFFSADTARMDELVQAGLIRAADVRKPIGNVLVVVVPAGGTTRIESPQDLTALPRLALADPAGVPAGVYAKKWLESIGLWSAMEPKVVPTLDVRAALAAVATEAAPAGIVYKTDAAVSDKVKVAFTVKDGPEITYAVAPLVRTTSPAAGSFVAALEAAPARAIFARRGFIVRE